MTFLTGHAMWPGLVVDDSHISAQGFQIKLLLADQFLFNFSVPMILQGLEFCFLEEYFFSVRYILFWSLTSLSVALILLLFRLKTKQIISFLRGLLSSLHLKCKKPRFVRALEEAKT